MDNIKVFELGMLPVLAKLDTYDKETLKIMDSKLAIAAVCFLPDVELLPKYPYTIQGVIYSRYFEL